MSQEKKNTSKNKNIKPPKFNLYWIYGAVFVLFIGYQIFNSDSLSTKNLSQNEFENILTENDIERISIINNVVANIFIKNAALEKEQHKKNKGSLYTANSPMYYYKFGDLKNFQENLKVSKDEVIENVAEKILTQEKIVGVVDSNNNVVGSIKPSKIIDTVFGGRKNGS